MSGIHSLKLVMTLFALTSLLAGAPDQNATAALQKRLEGQYGLTRTTADKTDIVTAGAVLELEKDNLLMTNASGSVNPYHNTYKEGRITQNSLGKAEKTLGRFSRLPGAAAPPTGSRTFIAGERMWLTKIEVKDDRVVFTLFTDAYSEIRYQATLTFFGKGDLPPAGEVEKTIAEVFKVQNAEDSATAKSPGQPAASPGRRALPSNQAPEQAAAPLPAAADKPLAAIAPPPPPPVERQPQTIAVGQNPEQVKAILGNPGKTAKSGKKEVYFYKDLKVTFVDNKVSDVE